MYDTQQRRLKQKGMQTGICELHINLIRPIPSETGRARRNANFFGKKACRPSWQRMKYECYLYAFCSKKADSYITIHFCQKMHRNVEEVTLSHLCDAMMLYGGFIFVYIVSPYFSSCCHFSLFIEIQLYHGWLCEVGWFQLLCSSGSRKRLVLPLFSLHLRGKSCLRQTNEMLFS